MAIRRAKSSGTSQPSLGSGLTKGNGALPRSRRHQERTFLAAARSWKLRHPCCKGSYCCEEATFKWAKNDDVIAELAHQEVNKGCAQRGAPFKARQPLLTVKVKDREGERKKRPLCQQRNRKGSELWAKRYSEAPAKQTHVWNNQSQEPP